MQEDCGAAAWCTFLVKTDVQAVLVLIFIVHDVLAVIHDEFRNFPNVHHLIVLPIWIPGPVGVVVYLNVGDCTTRINSNTEGFVEVIDPDRCLGTALPVVCILTETVQPHKAYGIGGGSMSRYPSVYVICSGELYECLFCFAEKCLKIDVILETVNHCKNVRCRVCDHRPRRIRHG